MQKKTGLMVASLAAGLMLVLPASAQPSADAMPAHGHGGGMGHHMDMMGGGDSHFMMLLRSANLTPQQHEQVRQIMKNEKAQMASVHDGFHAVHEQIAARLLTPGPLTAADLAPLEQKATRYQQQITRNMIDTAVAIRNILTPEQIARLSQVHQQLQSLHQQMRNLLGPDAEMPSEQPE
ncbi:MAG TPA: Spy/CpxP family protein refolding chaperone [Rhizomicrobium sp.]|jgi:Spy/CpxP family protein refolding chaperone|nr:Spy/CpxP family protein refolding chaperone [Rhizomicrobium sp.]